MIDWGYLAAKLFTTIASWIDAGNLRNRVFKMAEEAEIMMTALEDIARMDRDNKMGKYAQRAIDLVKKLPKNELDQ
jgi:hypothetical protein